MTSAQTFNPSSGELRPHTTHSPYSRYRVFQVSLGKTPRRVDIDDCVSQSVLRFGSSRDRHVQARFTVLCRLMRTSWLAMSLVSSSISKTRRGVLSWIMVTRVALSAGEATSMLQTLYVTSVKCYILQLGLVEPQRESFEQKEGLSRNVTRTRQTKQQRAAVERSGRFGKDTAVSMTSKVFPFKCSLD